MATKFDRKTSKQQLLHLSLSLATVLICATCLQYHKNWSHVGKLRESLILPTVLIGEILKVTLARFFERFHDGFVNSNQKQEFAFSLRKIYGSFMLQIFCAILFGFACIILGAPVMYNYEQTIVLSLLLTVLTVSPTVFLLGERGTLKICFCEMPDFLTMDESIALHLFKYNALGAILGAWAGSVVAPLDWEQDWQVYPIPNMVGALVGSALSNICACIQVLYAIGKIYFNKNKKQS